MISLCSPAIVYLFFSITQILIDIYSGNNNTAFTKSIVTAMVTLLLNILCERGLDIVAWLIVFIPFMLMTVVVGMLMYIFGTEIVTGEYSSKNNENNTDDIKRDDNGNILIIDPEYNRNIDPVIYKHPYIIVPNPERNNPPPPSNAPIINSAPIGSSSPMYVS
jgi:hypothetical protein